MAKSSRRPNLRTGDRDHQRSSSAARSRSGSAMASSWSPFGGQQSEVSSERRRQQRRPSPQQPVYRAVPSIKSLFGTWSSPQRPVSPAVSTCVARHQRKEVLFATRRTGAGSHARKLSFNNRRCK